MVTNGDFENGHRTKRVSFGLRKYCNYSTQNIDARVTIEIITVNRNVAVMNGVKVDITT